ncbi:MAG: prepilin-type N-terminal cleavage/methylation domain-containing protein [Fimbriimonadaceae bacterium]|nr:prepilin-type N-terminal cleavage/methylation domain-containing protein [Fimbriimonadaceae bacterium]
MRRRKAFTLVEIMIVVLIIGILLAIAVPQWVGTRSRSQQKTCISQLRAISGAKEQFAMEFNKGTGDPVVAGDLVPTYIKGTSLPTCPAGGTYTIQNIGTEPTCSLSGQAPNPHVLP